MQRRKLKSIYQSRIIKFRYTHLDVSPGESLSLGTSVYSGGRSTTSCCTLPASACLLKAGFPPFCPTPPLLLRALKLCRGLSSCAAPGGRAGLSPSSWFITLSAPAGPFVPLLCTGRGGPCAESRGRDSSLPDADVAGGVILDEEEDGGGWKLWIAGDFGGSTPACPPDRR